MQESPSQTKRLIPLHWGYLKSKDVHTKDGVVAGNVRGVLIDPENRTAPQLILEVDRGTR
jgi:sporulation protein YlmC with PRC-barrel domain